MLYQVELLLVSKPRGRADSPAGPPAVRTVYDGVTHLNIIRVSQQDRQNWSDPHPHNRSVCPVEPNVVLKDV